MRFCLDEADKKKCLQRSVGFEVYCTNFLDMLIIKKWFLRGPLPELCLIVDLVDLPFSVFLDLTCINCLDVTCILRIVLLRGRPQGGRAVFSIFLVLILMLMMVLIERA